MDAIGLQKFINQCDVAEKDEATFVDFNGRRFRAPFRCLCCGDEVSLAQFCFGRACGPCDCGACDSMNTAFDPRRAHLRLPRNWFFEISEEVEISKT